MGAPRLECESNVYHVVTRGVNQQLIFEDDADRTHFLGLLGRTLAQTGELFAWCLMDNHVHLLVRLDLPGLSRQMGYLLSRYATYFNARHGRTGHLFQSRFSSEPIATDEHLLRAVRYIHCNPQKAGIALAREYRWSSYSSYLGHPGICSTQLVLDLLGGVEGFVLFHQELEPRGFIDVPNRLTHLSDSAALELAREVTGALPVECVSSLPKAARDAVLGALKERGLTIAQIQRITGISRTIIHRA